MFRIHLFNPIVVICFLFLFVSCSQDPLKDISSHLRKGVLKKGVHNKGSIPDHYLPNSVRVLLNGKADLHLNFLEGEESVYFLQAKPILDDFPYEIDVYFDEKIKDSLSSDIEWSYDSSKKEIQIIWTPPLNFTKEKDSKTVMLPFEIVLKGKNLKTPLYIPKEIKATVEKTYDPLEIVSLSFFDSHYEKMEDGKLYQIPKDREVNLRLGRRVYTYTDQKYEEIKSDFSEVRGSLYDTRIQFLEIPFHGRISKDVKNRLRKDVYEKHQKLTCDGDGALFKSQEDGNAVCYFKIKNGGDDPLNLDKSMYELRYVISDEYKNLKEELYFRSPLNCNGIDNPERSQRHFKEKDKNGKSITSCYTKVSLDRKFFEPVDLYKFSKINTKDVSVSLKKEDMKPFLLLLPKFLKLQIAGYKPFSLSAAGAGEARLSLPLLDLDLYAGEIQLKVKDINYSSFMDIKVLNRPLLPLFELNFLSQNSSIQLDYSLWELSYKIKPLDLSLSPEGVEVFNFLNLNDFNKFSLPLMAVGSNSQMSAPIDFNIFVFPRLQVSYLNQKNPRKEVSYSQSLVLEGAADESATEEVVETDSSSDGQLKVDEVLFSFSHHVKVKYDFPKDSYEKIVRAVPLSIPLSNYEVWIDKKKDSVDKISLNRLEDIIQINLSPNFSFGSCEEDDVGVISDIDKNTFSRVECDCKSVKNIDKNPDRKRDLLERECAFKVNILAKAKDRRHQKSSYVYYGYGFRQNQVQLKSLLFDIPIYLNKWVIFKHMFMDGGKESVLEENSLSLKDYHIFFNLKPVINCAGEHNAKDRMCTVSYPIATHNQVPLDFKEYFLSQLNIKTTCKDVQGNVVSCPCSRELNVDTSGFSKRCFFGRSHGEMTFGLETKSDNIFFASTKKVLHKKDLKKIEDIKISY